MNAIPFEFHMNCCGKDGFEEWVDRFVFVMLGLRYSRGDAIRRIELLRESVNCIHLAERRKETLLLRANFLAWPVNFLASRSLALHPFPSPLTHRSYFLARAEFLLDSHVSAPDMTNFWIAQRSTNNEASKRLLPKAYFGEGVEWKGLNRFFLFFPPRSTHTPHTAIPLFFFFIANLLPNNR